MQPIGSAPVFNLSVGMESVFPIHSSAMVTMIAVIGQTKQIAVSTRTEKRKVYLCSATSRGIVLFFSFLTVKCCKYPAVVGVMCFPSMSLMKMCKHNVLRRRVCMLRYKFCRCSRYPLLLTMHLSTVSIG